MNKRKIMTATLIAAALIILIIAGRGLRNKIEDRYVFDKSSNIKLADIEAYDEFIDFNEENPKDYFRDQVAGKYTLRFFLYMDEMFKDSKNLEDCMDKARRYLESAFSSPELAEQMLEMYKKYITYQISLQGKMKEWGVPRTPDEVISNLHRLQNYRRDMFGTEEADIIFGAKVKAEEYYIRRNAVIIDNNLYGHEKEQKLQKLDANMWGDEADSMNDQIMPYMRYQEKLQLYQKDLFEMKSDEDKQAKMRQLRNEIFNPDQMKRLEDVDRLIAEEKKVREQYFSHENAIQSDPNLDQESKEKRIRELQNATFGDEADAFRRGQAIEKGAKQYIR